MWVLLAVISLVLVENADSLLISMGLGVHLVSNRIARDPDSYDAVIAVTLLSTVPKDFHRVTCSRDTV